MRRRDFLTGTISAAAMAGAPQLARAVSDEDARLIAQSKQELASAAGDPQATFGFRRAAKDAPWLEDVRGGIALVGDVKGGLANRGTAALIDADGTLETAAHLIKGTGPVPVNFFARGSRRPLTTQAEILGIDRNLDIAFLGIDPAFMAAHRLAPLKWDPAARDPAPGRSFIIAGYALGNPRLHAASVTAQSYEEHADAELFQGVELSPARDCKIVAHGVGYFGMSGGPGLGKNGAIAGAVNIVTNAKVATLYVTPESALRGAYIRLLPDRARRAGVAAPAEPARPECGFNNMPTPKP